MLAYVLPETVATLTFILAMFGPDSQESWIDRFDLLGSLFMVLPNGPLTYCICIVGGLWCAWHAVLCRWVGVGVPQCALVACLASSQYA
jgi:hypothetical protein